MSLLDSPQEISIWDGGLPQHPSPPWNYLLTFNIGGLTNEYFGNAFFLRDGKLVEVPCFSGYETLDFPPLGVLEAFVTSGGLSTMPWTFQGKLHRLENKTLRYLGHRDQFKAFADLGLLDLEPLEVKGSPVVPRDVLHGLLEPRISQGEMEDIALMRVTCRGEHGGVPAEATIELVDYYDANTGFMAMQRLTGWHASILAILATQGKLARGAIPVELAAPGDIIVLEAKKRGFSFQEQRVSKK
jgi:lysine 6-dehydrogenase